MMADDALALRRRVGRLEGWMVALVTLEASHNPWVISLFGYLAVHPIAATAVSAVGGLGLLSLVTRSL